MGSIIKFSFDQDDVFRNTAVFKNHREYIVWRFAQMGYLVTKWGWEMTGKETDSSGKERGVWKQNKDGIQFKRNDSDIDLSIEVSGEVGVNIREIKDDERK